MSCFVNDLTFVLFALVFLNRMSGGRSWEGRQRNGTHLGSGVSQDKRTSSPFIEETLSMQTLIDFGCGIFVAVFVCLR